jgi:hypothetical protein
MSDDVLDPPKPPVPRLNDSPHAPVFYVDEVSGGGPNGSTFNLTFARVQFDYSEGKARAYKQVVMRLVMPTAALQHAVKFVADSLAKAAEAAPPPTAPPVPKSNLN